MFEINAEKSPCTLVILQSQSSIIAVLPDSARNAMLALHMCLYHGDIPNIVMLGHMRDSSAYLVF